MLLVSCTVAAHPVDQRPAPGGPLEVERKAFVHVEKVGGMVGGHTAVSDARHVGLGGLVQVTREETDGRLHLLRQGQVDAQSLFESLAHGDPLPAPQVPEGPVEDSEYYPPSITITRFIPAHGYRVFSVEGEPPSGARAVVDRVWTLADAAEVAPAEPGLYVRAYRIPPKDEESSTPDVVVPVARVNGDPKLRRVLEEEMALVRVGGEKDMVVLGQSFTIIPGRPVHFQVAERRYVMFAFRYAGGS